MRAKGGSSNSRGGGGGRIALRYTTSTFTGTTDVLGASPSGEAGSVSPGNLRVADGSAAQAGNAFGGAGAQNDIVACRFNLKTDGNADDKAFETIQVTQLVFDLSGVFGIASGDIGDVHVYTDANNNGVIDGGDTEVAHTGATPSISGATGTLTVNFGAGAFTLNDTALVSKTVTNAVDTVNDRVTITGHTLITGQAIYLTFTAGGAVPVGTSAMTLYYVNVFDANTVSLHTTRANAAAGTSKVDLTGNGSGTVTAKTCPLDFLLRMDVANVAASETLSIQLNVANSKITAAGTSLAIACATGQAGRGFAELTGSTTAANHLIPGPPVITAQPSDQSVNRGATATFSVTAGGPGPIAYQWKLNGVDIGGATSSSYTTPATVAGDDGKQYTVVATNAYGSATSSIATLHINPLITASAGANGSIAPAGVTTVAYNGTQAYTIMPNPGFAILSVLVDGVPVSASTPYTFTSTIVDHTIVANFVVATHFITATAGAGGAISPSGAFGVAHGGNQTFVITPNTGYHIAFVLVDGVSVGTVGSYPFSNVTTGHTIAASFAIDTFTITASVGSPAHGAISPSGAVSVNYGASQTFTLTAEAGWAVAEVLLDGVDVGPVTTYTFSNVTANHTITVGKYETPKSPLEVEATAAPEVMQLGETVQLNCIPSGGTGIYLSFAWSGPDGFTSTVQTPASFALKVPGAYTYTVTVIDAVGLVASDSVTVVVGQPLNSALVKRGGLKYRVYAESADPLGEPRDWFRLTVWGLALNPGDRVALQVNHVSLGDLSAGDGLTLDGKGRATGQLGVPPHVFTNCRLRYQAKHRKIFVCVAGGWANTAGASVVRGSSGVAAGVPVAVLIDRAPADGSIDTAAIVPIEIQVKTQTVDGATMIESGKGSGE